MDSGRIVWAGSARPTAPEAGTLPFFNCIVLAKSLSEKSKPPPGPLTGRFFKQALRNRTM
jgi:hypothetical protein